MRQSLSGSCASSSSCCTCPSTLRASPSPARTGAGLCLSGQPARVHPHACSVVWHPAAALCRSLRSCREPSARALLPTARPCKSGCCMKTALDERGCSVRVRSADRQDGLRMHKAVRARDMQSGRPTSFQALQLLLQADERALGVRVRQALPIHPGVHSCRHISTLRHPPGRLRIQAHVNNVAQETAPCSTSGHHSFPKTPGWSAGDQTPGTGTHVHSTQYLFLELFKSNRHHASAWGR